MTDYFLSHLPEYLVPYWNLCFTDDSGELRDTSSVVIAISGIYETVFKVISEHVKKAGRILSSLIENYLASSIEGSNGLLIDAMYGRARGIRKSITSGVIISSLRLVSRKPALTGRGIGEQDFCIDFLPAERELVGIASHCFSTEEVYGGRGREGEPFDLLVVFKIVYDYLVASFSKHVQVVPFNAEKAWP